MQIPTHLANAELVSELTRLARGERRTTAVMIAHLVEFDARRLYLGAGFRSLFLYCTEVLRLSKHEAYNRVEAARVARNFPLVLDLLGEGSVNLTTVRLLAPHLTTDNHENLMTAASGKSKREVEELLALLFPRPDVPSSVRKVPAPPSDSDAAALTTATNGGTAETAAPEVGSSSKVGPSIEAGPSRTGPSFEDPVPSPPLTAPAPPRREVVRPLAVDRYEVRFTASAETCQNLRLAKDLLRHVIPNGDTGEIFDRALKALLAELAKKKYGAARTPRSGCGGRASDRAGGRYIPAKVKRAVWLRDGGRCAFVGKGNRRCAERGFLEFHHVQPYGVGGPATVENIEIRCRAHNAYEAELFYGHGFVASGARKKQLVPERVIARPPRPVAPAEGTLV